MPVTVNILSSFLEPRVAVIRVLYYYTRQLRRVINRTDKLVVVEQDV